MKKSYISHELLFWLYYWRLVILKPITTKYLQFSMIIVLVYVAFLFLLSFMKSPPKYSTISSYHILILSFFVIFFIEYALFNNHYAISYMYQLLMFGVFSAFFLLRVKNLDSFLKTYFWSSLILFIIYFTDPLVSFRYFDNYMVFGFQLALPTFLGLDIGRSYFEKKWVIIPEIICFIEVAIFANRSCIISIIVYFIIKELYLNKNDTKRIFRRISVLAAIGIISLNYVSIVKSINIFLQKSGYNSYSFSQYLYYIENGEFSTSNNSVTGGRANILKDAWEFFLESPIIGNGSGSFVERYGYYTHNIISDLLIQYGIIFALIFLLIVIKVSFKSFFPKNSQKTRYFSIIILLMWFPKLLFSSELFQEIGIWCYLAAGLSNMFDQFTENNSVENNDKNMEVYKNG